MIATVADLVDAQILERLRLHGWTFARDGLIVAIAYVLADFVRFDGLIPQKFWLPLLLGVLLAIGVHSTSNYLFGIHRRIWQYAGILDVRALFDAALLSVVAIALVDFFLPGPRLLPLSVIPAGGLFSLGGFLGMRLWRRLRGARGGDQAEFLRVLIVGAGQGGQLVVADLLANREWREQPVGFLDDDPRKRKARIHGVPVLGTIDALPKIVEVQSIDIIGVAIPSASAHLLDRILALAQETDSRIQILPSRAQVLAGETSMRLRDLDLDDLLNRVPSSASVQATPAEDLLDDRVILVTGGAGSIGSELCRQILTLKPQRVLALDNNETGLFELEADLAGTPHGALLTTVLADITDASKINQVFRRFQPDVIFHAAAYKHVPVLESYPEEALSANVLGTLNLCKAASDHGSERFVFVSTDKAVHPVNALGYSKRIGELIVRAHQKNKPILCCVRFANVIGSRGSAVPGFIRQIEAGGPVTVTHPDAERYFMTIPEAVGLVIQAGAMAESGELFMLDMGEPIKISELVRRIIRLRGLRIGKDIEIVYTGLRPGEKLTEELTFEVEEVRPTSNPSIYAVLDPVHPDLQTLERRVDRLLEIAASGDTDGVRNGLADVALDRQPEDLRQIGPA